MGKLTKSDQSDPSDNPKNLRKIAKTKSKQADVTVRMVIRTLNDLEENRKSDDDVGHSLAKIRGYIQHNYGLKMTKNRQELIKNIMRTEFEANRIDMANSDGKLNFTKRFVSKITDSDIEDETDQESNQENEDKNEENEE